MSASDGIEESGESLFARQCIMNIFAAAEALDNCSTQAHLYQYAINVEPLFKKHLDLLCPPNWQDSYEQLDPIHLPKYPDDLIRRNPLIIKQVQYLVMTHRFNDFVYQIFVLWSYDPEYIATILNRHFDRIMDEVDSFRSSCRNGTT